MASPIAEFVHYSIPAWDATGEAAIELGSQIESNKTAIVSPSVLVSKLNPRKPRVVAVPAPIKRACCSTEFICYQPKKSNEDLNFWADYFASPDFSARLARVAVGSTNSHTRAAPKETLKWFVPEVPPAEQGKIAQIFDTLDTAIHETEAIIAKLKAVKQGLLHDLLTRGIDANGELRPPQVEARHRYKESSLGWIPQEWNVRPLSSCIASLDAGVSVNSEDRPHGANEIGVLKTSALSQGMFYPDQNKTVVTKEARLVREPVLADSILVSRMNTPQLVGESCYVAESWPTLFLPDRIWQLKKTAPDSVHMRWLSYVLLTSNYRTYIEVHATGTSGSMKNLPKSRLKDMQIAFPEGNEQILIAERLAKADDLITAESMQLVKLEAEKSGLMDDLLIGRVRVTPLLAEAAQQGSA